MALTPINGDLTAGLAGQRSETINPSPDPFVTGDRPLILGTDEPVASGLDLAPMSVVGFNASGELVEAVRDSSNPNDDVQAIGIAIYGAVAADGDVAHVYRAGCFNPTLIAWPASYDTDEKKRTAFYGAPAPTAIVIRAPRAATIA